MVRRPSIAVVCLLAALSSAGAAEQAAPKARAEGKGAAPKGKAAADHLLDRVAVVGASLSSGFGLDLTLAAVLETALLRKHRPVEDASSAMFFMEPEKQAASAIEKALAGKPTLVVGADFLFWFGYGERAGAADPEAARLESLEKGLKLLEKVHGPLVIGDLPDMSASIGKMLSADAVPKPATLETLNRRIAEWAKGRPGTLVLPLRRHMETIRSGKAVKVGKNEWPAAALLQDDRLHPTIAGMAAVVELAFEEVLSRKLGAEPADLDRDGKAVEKRAAALASAEAEKRAKAAAKRTRKAPKK